jgi:ascorbate PTS system EIIA or EIIAB component
MIEKLINEEVVEVKVKAKNWEEAVRKSGEVLLKNNKIKKEYIDSMVGTVKKMGPYIVMTKGVAMPHGRPEDGVLDLGISIISLESSVEFGNEDFDPVKLLIGLCAKDNLEHIELLKDLSSILEDEDIIEKIDSINSKEELINLILNKYKNNK